MDIRQYNKRCITLYINTTKGSLLTYINQFSTTFITK